MEFREIFRVVANAATGTVTVFDSMGMAAAEKRIPIRDRPRRVCYTRLFNVILYLKTILLHCHHIIENYCVNLELLP